MKTSLKPIPARRAEIFKRFETDDYLIKTVLMGGEEMSNDDKLVYLGAGFGHLAGSILEAPNTDFWQHRMLGYCVGWMMALGVEDPWTLINSRRENYEGALNDGVILLNWVSPKVPNERKFRALAIQFGNVASAVDCLDKMTTAKVACQNRLKRELVALAACCCAWLETEETK